MTAVYAPVRLARPAQGTTFDGTDDNIRLKVGACNVTAAITMAVIVRRNSTAYNGLIGLHTSGGTATYSLEISDSGAGSTLDFSGNRTGSPTVVNADGWCLIAVTKADGTVTPRGHKYVYSTNAWTHQDWTGTVANQSSVAGGTVRFGQWQTTDFFGGDILVAGVWDRSLADSDIEQLARHPDNWQKLNPKGLWFLDEKLIRDVMGFSHESSRTGTTLIPNMTQFRGYLSRPTAQWWESLLVEVAAAGTTLEPAAIPIPITTPAPTLALVLAPAAVAVPVATPAPTVALVVAPAALAINIVVVQPTLSLGVAPAPVTVPIQVAAPTPALTVSPAATAVPLAVPTPTVEVGGAVTLTPDPVPVPIAIAAPTLTLALSPAPVTVPLALPAPAPALALGPAPVAMPVSVAAPQLTLGVVPSPVTIPLVIVAGQLALVLVPSAVALPIVVVTPTVEGGQQGATPRPALIVPARGVGGLPVPARGVGGLPVPARGVALEVPED